VIVGQTMGREIAFEKEDKLEHEKVLTETDFSENEFMMDVTFGSKNQTNLPGERNCMKGDEKGRLQIDFFLEQLISGKVSPSEQRRLESLSLA